MNEELQQTLDQIGEALAQLTQEVQQTSYKVNKVIIPTLTEAFENDQMTQRRGQFDEQFGGQFPNQEMADYAFNQVDAQRDNPDFDAQGYVQGLLDEAKQRVLELAKAMGITPSEAGEVVGEEAEQEGAQGGEEGEPSGEAEIEGGEQAAEQEAEGATDEQAGEEAKAVEENVEDGQAAGNDEPVSPQEKTPQQVEDETYQAMKKRGILR